MKAKKSLLSLKLVKSAKKAASSLKKEYKSDDSAKRQQKQWEKKGYKVTRRKNVLYLRSI